MVRQSTINDLPVGRSVDETLRLVQAFQFVDKHGEGESNGHNGLTGGAKTKVIFLCYKKTRELSVLNE